MFFYKFAIFVNLIAIHMHSCICKKYNNYTLYRGIPVSDKDLEFFERLNQFYEVNFWREPGVLYRPVEFTIRPEDRDNFIKDAENNGIYLTTIIKDVQSAFDEQTVKTYIRRKMDSFDWRNYFRLRDIYNWLQDLKKTYPTLIQLQSIGRSYQGRDILAVRLTHKKSKMRSTVIVEGGIHAREWISSAFVTYLINELLHAPNRNNTNLKNIALTYDWYFVPILNPDGYEYTHNQDRMWRKNRHSGNYGVDINRNFDFAFGTVGVSYDKSSETYCGEAPFSEVESKAMALFVQSHSKNLEYYLAFHSYGQYIIIPYAHSTKHYDNYDEVKSMGQTASKQILRKYGTQYTVGTAYDTVGYTTSGVSGCWVKKTFRVPYVLTFELRDEGHYGFALPPQYILPTCEETIDGLVSLLTPRTGKITKLKEESLNDASSNVFDKIAIIFNVLLFNIVYFD